MKNLILCLLLFAAYNAEAQDDYYRKKAKSYTREAGYWQKRADGYRREAKYCLNKAEGHQRNAAYYIRKDDLGRTRTYTRYADLAAALNKN